MIIIDRLHLSSSSSSSGGCVGGERMNRVIHKSYFARYFKVSLRVRGMPAPDS